MTKTERINSKVVFGKLTRIKHFVFSVLTILIMAISSVSYGGPAYENPSNSRPAYDRQWYLGGGSGVSDPLFEGFDNGLRLDLYTGIEVSNQVSVEAGVIHLGEFDAAANNSLDISGATIALRGVNRVSQFSSLYMKLGVLAWRTEPTLFLNGVQIDTGNKSGKSFWVGFGFGLHLGTHITIWSGVEHFSQVDDVDVNSYSGGLQFSF